MDLALFRFLSGLAGHGFDSLIVFCAAYLQYVLLACLVGVALWPPRRFKFLITAIAAAVVARLGVKTLIIAFVHRARPFVALPDVRTLITPDAGENLQSFPSGHAIFFFALAAVAYHYDRRLSAVLYAGALLMGIARVAAGVHWPSDILAGALLGMLVGWVAIRLADRR